MNWLEVAAITANSIFLCSYILFVYHIYSKKEAGFSGWFLLLTLLAFCILTVGFSVQWYMVRSLWNLIFATYDAAGILLSVAALEGWRRYR
jgi:hypothetical protein